MSIATIIFADDNLDTGRYTVDVTVEDAKTDDGFATAAHVTSMFVAKVVNTPEFAEGAAAYGHAKGWSIRNDNPQRIVLTLTDIDLDAGSFDLSVKEDENAIVENSVTAAYMTAMFIRDAMGSNEFRMACTEFAHSLVKGRSDAVVNEPMMEAVGANTSDTNTKAA